MSENKKVNNFNSFNYEKKISKLNNIQMNKISNNTNMSKSIQLQSLKSLLDSERLEINELIQVGKATKSDLDKLPKIIKKGSKYTKLFLTWNRKKIREKKTFFYADDDKMYNPITNRFSDKKYDKRYKKKVLSKATQKKQIKYNTEFKKILSNTSENYKNLILNDLLNLKKGEDMIVDLTKIKFSDLVEILIDNVKEGQKLVSTAIGDNNRWITLSQSNLINLKEITDLTYQRNGSDIEYLFDSIQNQGKIIIQWINDDIDFIQDKKKSYKKPAGSFFNYYNLTHFDLSRYDIYNEKRDDYKDNCLYIALNNSGVIELSKLNQIKDLFRNGLIPTCKMTEISNVLGVCISINRKINGKNTITKYGDKTKDIINIGLINEHYILIEKTNITRFCLENYEEVKDIKDCNKIYKKIGGKYKKSNDRFINSLDVVRILLENKNLIQKIPCKDLMDTQFFSSDIENDILDYNSSIYDPEDNPTGNLKINKISKTDNQDCYKVFYDFETNTSGDKHVPYLVCFITEDNKTGCFKGKLCGKYFINHLKKMNKEKIMLIAHNQRYDFTFILDHVFCLKPILKGNRLMGGSGRIYRTKEDYTEIVFQDSLNLIPSSLRHFGKMFHLKQEKEVMPYDVYTTENIENRYVKYSIIKKFLKEEDREQFKNNCKKWGCLNNLDLDNEGKLSSYINIIKYSEKYCEIDCDVLKRGYTKFRNDMILITGLDMINYCSIASLSNDYMINEGCFNDCFSLSGVPRAFIQKCVVGGKVMCSKNQKQIIDYEQADYDGVSLYPSSMSRIKGYLRGDPKVLQKNQLNRDFLFSEKVDGFFVKVLCKNNPNVNRDFPVLSSMTDEGIRNFSNDTETNTYYLDKTSFEDAENFQGLDFEILQGYYYNQGHNNKVNETIRYLFKQRLIKKKEGNPIQNIYKLVMNSSYGKTMLKPIDSETEIIYKKNWSEYLNRNYNFIKEYTISDNIVIVKTIKPIARHFNNVYAGVEILSMSKRIMNEVMYCAEDNGLKITYTDTDSIHIKYDEVKVLEEKYLEKYGRVLSGKDLGQFHIDFDLEGSEGEIKSIKSVFLGKKCYMDLLQGKDKDGNIIYGEHLRMKGIPNESIQYTCKQLNINSYDLYKQLYEGKSIDFDLLCGGKKCSFQYNKDLSVRSRGYNDGVSEFSRKLVF